MTMAKRDELVSFSPLAMIIKRARVVSPLPNGERDTEGEDCSMSVI